MVYPRDIRVFQRLTSPLFSSGGSFGGMFAAMSPATLHAEIVRMNVKFFDVFIEFPASNTVILHLLSL